MLIGSTRSRWLRFSGSWPVVGALLAVAADNACCLRVLRRTCEPPSIISPMAMKGSLGSPGTSDISSSSPPTMPSTRGLPNNWLVTSMPRLRSVSDAARVTIMPVAVEMSSAGIWEVKPSPTVSSV